MTEAADEALRITVSGFDERLVFAPGGPTTDKGEGGVEDEALAAQPAADPATEPAVSEGPSRVAVRALPPTQADRAAGRRRFEASVEGWLFEVHVESESRARLRERTMQARASVAAVGDLHVTAQIPGRVVRLWVAEGDTVEAGQRLLAVEAMKMENEVRATRPGTVASVKVAVGSSVELGDELLTVR